MLKATPSSLIPALLDAVIQIQGSPAVRLSQSSDGVPVAGVLPSVYPFTGAAAVPRCQPHNAALLGGKGKAAFDFNIGAPFGIQYRNYGTLPGGTEYPPAIVEQNIAGFGYHTENRVLLSHLIDVRADNWLCGFWYAASHFGRSSQAWHPPSFPRRLL